jgi:hypothetical protein
MARGGFFEDFSNSAAFFASIAARLAKNNTDENELVSYDDKSWCDKTFQRLPAATSACFFFKFAFTSSEALGGLLCETAAGAPPFGKEMEGTEIEGRSKLGPSYPENGLATIRPKASPATPRAPLCKKDMLEQLLGAQGFLNLHFD